jgi:hypothetical protein
VAAKANSICGDARWVSSVGGAGAVLGMVEGIAAVCRRRGEKIKPVFTAGPRRCEISPFTVSRCEGVGHVLVAVLLAGVDEVVVAVPVG